MFKHHIAPDKDWRQLGDVDENVKIEELHKRHNFLACFCKLIVYNVIFIRVAAPMFKHHLKITDLPSELLSLILKEVVLSDGDTAYLKLSLVCKKFQCIITREGFKKGCHFDWLLSLKPKGFWDKHRDRFLPFDIRTCRSCGSVFKYEPSLYWGGHGIRGEFVGSYDSIPNPSFCCAFCEAIEDNYNDSIE